MSRRFAVLAVAAALLFGGACSEDNEVGSGVDASKLGKGEGGPRLGETTTTVAPVTTAAPATTAAPTTTAAPKATTTAPPTTAVQAAITISITNTAFDPRQAAVRKGSVVKWVNNDSKPRKLVDASGAFTSPTIPPGGSWEYKADRPGKFDYSDPDVPFAQGTLIVS